MPRDGFKYAILPNVLSTQKLHHSPNAVNLPIFLSPLPLCIWSCLSSEPIDDTRLTSDCASLWERFSKFHATRARSPISLPDRNPPSSGLALSAMCEFAPRSSWPCPGRAAGGGTDGEG
ncbi:hypothetical protein BC937DRAFT_94775 [Endogone sp. FLAS-F59071]|nr:hypothetical protein BC937DRAFT_94775 [Endogone sp. FLAS-F59071]|eukprot:RUS13790.1 hypothetical protein BC937DRAFT_94775 [Endogone sp. FLAS-F59071]